MQRLIDANEILKSEHQHYDYMSDEYYVLVRDIENAPTVNVEPTEEQVREYCHKRCLTLVTAELFNEMKARWSAEPVRHGQWVENNGRYGWYCSQCKKENNYAYDYNENNVIELQDHYCPNCGAKMDESTMGQVKPSDGERREDVETD